MRMQYLRLAAKVLAITVTVVLLLGGAVYAWHRYTFPYGQSHCCLKALGLALLTYAEANDGTEQRQGKLIALAHYDGRPWLPRR